ncbi:hypothetical protein ACT3UT_07995 [Bacillus spizizenii ATCC 6633 = JCM 2499]|uniref:Yip1 domain-containing protein n=2 Tax=Bacillus spizizenii TaxID=96241 RepID=E0U012_BACSH|nr:hypothetical protein [Bacillus spizizenii]QCJ18265.1 hypothetical protein FA024_14535 [Bacillus subtilis]ADM39169.1 hypothetical protein BSUW23_15660 [Bacillus spizizenii str. W23]AJW84679.1 hypothetical protein BIS30_05625 [Bacillus spizizenii]EFG92011.1 hypothetical protein BSU6633_11880 [Bacillus spizizenii ATCC 6633 = JCM 2499]KFK78223.1 putative membrane protein [Bacillus spizizenii]
MIGQLSNKKIILSSFFIILICSLLFQFSISDKVLHIYYSSVGENAYDIGEKSVRTIVMFLQGFMIFTTFIEILIGGFILFIVAFILGSKKPKKTYLLLYTLTSLISAFKMLILSVVNYLTADSSLIYSASGTELSLQLLDPFLLISIAALYVAAGKLTELDKSKRIILTGCFVLIKLFNIFFNYFMVDKI